jgi:biopolymer transport protein ExbD
VELAKLENAVKVPHALREDAIHVAVRRDGRVYFSDNSFLAEQVSSNDLPRLINEAIAKGSEPRVYLSCDARSRFKLDKDVLDAISASRAQHLTLLFQGPKDFLEPVNIFRQ